MLYENVLILQCFPVTKPDCKTTCNYLMVAKEVEDIPVDIWCQNDVVSTSMRRQHQMPTVMFMDVLITLHILLRREIDLYS